MRYKPVHAACSWHDSICLDVTTLIRQYARVTLRPKKNTVTLAERRMQRHSNLDFLASACALNGAADTQSGSDAKSTASCSLALYAGGKKLAYNAACTMA